MDDTLFLLSSDARKPVADVRAREYVSELPECSAADDNGADSIFKPANSTSIGKVIVPFINVSSLLPIIAPSRSWRQRSKTASASLRRRVPARRGEVLLEISEG